jgi:lysophospholipase L1-like esterase
VVAASLVLSTRVTPIPLPSPTAVAAAERVPAVTNPAGRVDAAAALRQMRALSRPWPRPVTPLVPAPGVRGFLPPGDWSRLTNTCDVDHPAPADVRPVPHAPGPKVLLLGDSVGCFVGASLDINQRQNGVVTLNRARLGCPLVAPRAARSLDGESVPVYPACIDGQQQAIAAFRPDVSVLMVGGPDISEADLGNGQWVSACSTTFDAWYEAGARTTIRALSATGASVVVVSIVHPPKIVDIGPGITMPPVYSRDVECENAALRRAVRSEPRAHLLDLDAYVCPHGTCRDRIDGVALRTDGRHFQGPAANIISTWILQGVLEQTGLQPFS